MFIDLMVSIERIKQLRDETGISISECKKALESAGGDEEKARAILREWGKAVAAKKQERGVGPGLVGAYIHNNGMAGALVEVRCETDFVARSDDFRALVHELGLQVVSMDPESVEALMEQPYARDQAKSVKNLIDETIAKLGENIRVRQFSRFAI